MHYVAHGWHREGFQPERRGNRGAGDRAGSGSPHTYKDNAAKYVANTDVDQRKTALGQRRSADSGPGNDVDRPQLAAAAAADVFDKV